MSRAYRKRVQCPFESWPPNHLEAYVRQVTLEDEGCAARRSEGNRCDALMSGMNRRAAVRHDKNDCAEGVRGSHDGRDASGLSRAVSVCNTAIVVIDNYRAHTGPRCSRGHRKSMAVVG